ncbi:hypothetical protein AHW83_23715 [Salmonella enterica subsp. enterica]|nr:hypothetical protein [Salmonella enterica subsp. enterica]
MPLRFNISYINHEKIYPDNLYHMKDRVLLNVFSIMACNIQKSSTRYVGIVFNLLRVTVAILNVSTLPT